MLNRKNDIPTPVYYKLQSAIKEKIEDGHWRPGDMIPPERLFAEEHKLSIGTVKKAISNLVNEGFLYRIQGKGTFVTGNYVRRDKLRYYRYYENFVDSKTKMKIKLLDMKKIKPVLSINRLLKLRITEELYKISRSMNFDEGPRIMSISYLPQKQFKDLDSPLFRTKMEKVALYSILEESYGVPTIYNQELIGAENADKEIASQLKVPVGTALVTIEMLSYTYKDRPYEYRISYCVTDTEKLFREY